MKIDIKGAIIPNDDKWIYDWFEMDSTSPKDVIDCIGKADGEKLDIYIDSGGGDIFAASTIYSAIREYTGEIKIHVTGLAASAASVIACAGKSDISPTAMLMVHNVSGMGNGDYHVMDKTSDTLKKANKAVAAAYVEKTGMTEDETLKMMNSETWLTAQEAVKKGLIDEISGESYTRLVASSCGLLPQPVIDRIRETLNNKAHAEKQSLLTAKLNLLKLKGGM